MNASDLKLKLLKYYVALLFCIDHQVSEMMNFNVFREPRDKDRR